MALDAFHSVIAIPALGGHDQKMAFMALHGCGEGGDGRMAAAPTARLSVGQRGEVL